MDVILRCEYSPIPGDTRHQCTLSASFLLFEDETHICRVACMEHIMLLIRRETSDYPRLTFWIHPILPHMTVGIRHGQPPVSNRGVKPPTIGQRNA